ncbi:unnamed protein product [Discosporangium mesarthrocarpum]
MVAHFLELRESSGKIPLGVGKATAAEFGVPGTMAHRHLKTYQLQKAGGQQLGVSRGRKRRCGRPSALIHLWEVPIVHSTSCRKEAAKVGFPLSLLWSLFKRVEGWRHTRWVKPTLTDKQRVGQVAFALSHLHRRAGSGVLVDDMFDFVHVDKKRFYLKKDEKNVCPQPNEEVLKPPRASNKRFILKMMFLAAVARPRKLFNGVQFDGKIII